jgi:hypothetical protein
MRPSITAFPAPALVSTRIIPPSSLTAPPVALGTRFQALPGSPTAQLAQIGATMITIGVNSLGAM